jgi:DNA-binding transcriptional LysR family regulator
MTDRQLKSFIKAADSGSFSKAAEASYISPAALIQQINLLEKDLGFSLFDRTTHGITLTPAGLSFYPAAKKIISIYESALEKGRKIADSRTSLTIAFTMGQMPEFLITANREFITSYPEIKFSYAPATLNSQFSDLRRNRIDLSITAEPESQYCEGLLFLPICEDTYSFCMSPVHPLAHKKMLRPSDLSSYPVKYGQYPYLKTAFQSQLLKYGIKGEEISGEQSTAAALNALSDGSLYVIHSRWAYPYRDFLTVVPSTISAGMIGVLTREVHASAVDDFYRICCDVINSSGKD